MAEREALVNEDNPETLRVLLKVVAPVTPRVEEKVPAPVTPSVPLMVALPPMEAMFETSRLLEAEALVKKPLVAVS